MNETLTAQEPPAPLPASTPADRRLSKKERSRAGAKEYLHRVHTIREYLGSGVHDYQIKQKCLNEWGISWRQAERYMARAREICRQESGKTVEELRAESANFADACKKAKDASWGEKLKAEEHRAKMLGYMPPQIVHANVSSEVTVRYEKMTDAELDQTLRSRVETLKRVAPEAALLLGGRNGGNGDGHQSEN